MLSGDDAADAMRIARDTGVLEHLLPELADTVGFDQRSRYHDLTVDEHVFAVLQRACELDAPETVRMAAILHDNAKPATAWGWLEHPTLGVEVRDEGEVRLKRQVPVCAREFLAAGDEERTDDLDLHYYAHPRVVDDALVEVRAEGRSHEELGAARARTVMSRFAGETGGNTAMTDKVVLLVGEHMYADDDAFLSLSQDAQARRARRFVRRVGVDNIEELMLLRRCDRGGKRERPAAGWDADISAFEESVRSQVTSQAAMHVSDLALDGRALAKAGFSGPTIGEVQRRLLDAVVEEPNLNVPERLLCMAAQMRADVEAETTRRMAERVAAKKRRGDLARERDKAAHRAAKAAAQSA